MADVGTWVGVMTGSGALLTAGGSLWIGVRRNARDKEAANDARTREMDKTLLDATAQAVSIYSKNVKSLQDTIDRLEHEVQECEADKERLKQRVAALEAIVRNP